MSIQSGTSFLEDGGRPRRALDDFLRRRRLARRRKVMEAPVELWLAKRDDAVGHAVTRATGWAWNDAVLRIGPWGLTTTPAGPSFIPFTMYRHRVEKFRIEGLSGPTGHRLLRWCVRNRKTFPSFSSLELIRASTANFFLLILYAAGILGRVPARWTATPDLIAQALKHVGFPVPIRDRPYTAGDLWQLPFVVRIEPPTGDVAA